MEDRVTPTELVNIYRTAKSTFLQLHRLMIRHGLIGDKERIIIYDLTHPQK